jgi:hypothetical protein
MPVSPKESPDNPRNLYIVKGIHIGNIATESQKKNRGEG